MDLVSRAFIHIYIYIVELLRRSDTQGLPRLMLTVLSLLYVK